MKKAIVTGGAGFIGSHLVQRLLATASCIVHVIDNFNTGKKKNLPRNKRLFVHDKSILDEGLDGVFAGTDVVFHLAALTRPQWSINHPLESNEVNVGGTLKVLEYCKRNDVKRVVFASSSSLYGSPKNYPTKETEDPRPMSPYGLQKYLGELYCRLYERMYGLEINCIRPFNVYGERQNLSGGYAPAVPNFINNLLAGKPGKITGTGEQSRDFTYIDDIVEIFILAATSSVHGESFNAGAGRSVTINYVYQTISRLMGRQISAVYIDPVYEPKKTLADTSKARALLGWKPRVKIEDGLKILLTKTGKIS